MVTLSLLPLVQAFLNGFLLVKGVALVAHLYLFLGQPHTLQDGFALSSTLSTDMFLEEVSVLLTTCNGNRRWDTSQLMLQLTTPTAAGQVPCNASHEQNTSTHAHSQCTGCDRGSLSMTPASGLLTTSISPAHTNRQEQMAVITGYYAKLTRSVKLIPWPGGHKVQFAATSNRLPSHPTKDGRATDSCFALIGAHQCDVISSDIQ